MYVPVVCVLDEIAWTLGWIFDICSILVGKWVGNSEQHVPLSLVLTTCGDVEASHWNARDFPERLSRDSGFAKIAIETESIWFPTALSTRNASRDPFTFAVWPKSRVTTDVPIPTFLLDDLNQGSDWVIFEKIEPDKYSD